MWCRSNFECFNDWKWLSGPEEILSSIKIEPSDSELELQIAVKKAQTLKLQEAVTESKNSIEKYTTLADFLFNPSDKCLVVVGDISLDQSGPSAALLPLCFFSLRLVRSSPVDGWWEMKQPRATEFYTMFSSYINMWFIWVSICSDIKCKQ
jgi:hypothetical protein